MGATVAQSVRTFFQANNFIDLEHAEGYGVKQPSQLKQMLPDGILLDTTIVSPLLVEQLNDTVADVLEKGEWLDVSEAIPMLIPVEEVAMLMSRCSAVAAMQASNRGAILADVVVVSQPFLKALLRRAEYEGKAAAKRALFGVTVKEDISQGMTHVQADVAGEDIAALVSRLRMGGGDGEGGEEGLGAEAQQDEEAQLHMSPVKGAKRGKDGKRVQKEFATKEGRQGKSQSRGSNRGRGGDSAAKKYKPCLRSLAQKIAEWYPDTDTPAGDCESLAELMAEEALPSAVDEYARLMAAATTEGCGLSGEALMAELSLRLVEMESPDGTRDLVEMTC